jgi:hypothetical protein
MKTAEWQCTVCGVTNRKLVPSGAHRATDRCVTCHTAHIIEANDRPVRWDARSFSKRPLVSPQASLGQVPSTSPPVGTPAPSGEGRQ